MSEIDFVCTVLMDGGDVTPWIRKVDISTEDAIDRKFTLTFSSWDHFSEANRWDIYGSYNPAEPFQEILIRNGTIPVDRYRAVTLGPNKVPHVMGLGYDYVWLTKRRAPRHTIVMVPNRRNNEDPVKQAIENYRGPIGRYQVWTHVSSLHSALNRLARAGGINVSIQIPNYDMAPYVIDPSLSYWKAIEKLSQPYAPHIYYVRQSNTLVIADRASEVMGASNTLTLSPKIVSDLQAQPIYTRRIRRVIIKVPQWR